MDKVTSRDGTPIAFERLGDGPPVILVCGATCDRALMHPTAEELAKHFTVFNYDRRGRGDSGDTAPYAVEREIEDLDALIAEAGGGRRCTGTPQARSSPSARRQRAYQSLGSSCTSLPSRPMRRSGAGAHASTARTSGPSWRRTAAATRSSCL